MVCIGIDLGATYRLLQRLKMRFLEAFVTMIVIICLIVENYQLGIYLDRLSAPSVVAYYDQPQSLPSPVSARRNLQNKAKEVHEHTTVTLTSSHHQ